MTVTSGPSREVYKWNAGGQLIQIDQFNPGDYAKIEYRYDVFGRLAAIKTTQFTSSNGPSEFMAIVWNGSERVLEIQIDSSANTRFDGKIVQSYLNGPNTGEVLAADVVVNSSGERRTIWMFADTVGTVRSYAYYGAVASNPTMMHRHYDAFGFEYDQTGTTDNDYLKQAPSIFAGSWRSDAAKLYDMSGRWYDPKTGRFLNDAGGENGYAARIDQLSLNSRGPTGTPISDSQWEAMTGAGPYTTLMGNTVGRAVHGLIGDNLAYASDTAMVGSVVGASVVLGVGAWMALPATATTAFLGKVATGIGVAGAAAGFANGALSTAASAQMSGQSTSVSDYISMGGINAFFGAVNPIDAFASLGAGLVGSGIGYASGNTSAGYLIGSTVGGIFGSGWDDYYRNAATFSHATKRSAVVAGVAGGVGAGVYGATGDIDAAITWGSLATLPGGMLSKLVPCFPAGTPILTPDGSKPIEEIRAGDLVLSRDESDVNGPVEPKVVEETFIRQGEILELTIGGQVIQMTPEHPVYVADKGWTPAGELQVGDYLSIVSMAEYSSANSSKLRYVVETDNDRLTPAALLDEPNSTVAICSDEWLQVEKTHSTGRLAIVYNFRVSDWHTYFVVDGVPHFALWVHNAGSQYVYRGDDF